MRITDNITYRHKILFYFLFLLTAFAIVVTIYQYKREHKIKSIYIQNSLRQYSDIVHNKIVSVNNINNLDNLISLFPDKNIRLTIIDKTGKVVFDNRVSNISTMENHINRPEIKMAESLGEGYQIRKSATTGQEYFYFAKLYNDYFVRTSFVYDQPVIDALKVDKMFILVIALILGFFIILVFFMSNQLGKSITALRDFATFAETQKGKLKKNKLPKDELGIIAEKIFNLYGKLQKTSKKLLIEQDKLINHFRYSTKGVAIFNKYQEKIFINTKFIQYSNLIFDSNYFSIKNFMTKPEFKEFSNFINKHLYNKKKKELKDIEVYTQKHANKGMYFEITIIVFSDKSYEINITDITKVEKDRILKQEITSNIAHELKSPVSIVLAYIETLMTNKIDKEKQEYFLERTFKQMKRLSALIDDVAVISKLDDSHDKFEIKKTNITDIVRNICKDFEAKLNENESKTEIDFPDSLIIRGNESLIYAIFQNLIDNSIKYSGIGSFISIKQYREDEHYYYFSYYNTGCSIPDEHLKLIFERFYRIDKGRSRNNGGTGLGLSIVKNAVLYHGGEITAITPENGGVEFLFNLKK